MLDSPGTHIRSTRSNNVVNGSPGCMNKDHVSKRANQLAAGARVHAAQLPQGADIRHTPLMSVFMISDQRCEVVTNVQRLVTNQHYMLCGRSCLFSTFMYDFPDEHRREP